jgi:SpoVK/Ycf46/Vps4 family AAA+-type ATPase
MARRKLTPHGLIAFLDVSSVEDIDKSEEVRDRGFQDLVIPDDYREHLVALVEDHQSAASFQKPQQKQHPASQMDLVRGKGRGLIILLHGPPGAGKTSTAETIAAYTKRPLYSITCGDIGTTAVDIERNLDRHFSLAARWGCVLLLDEADVFLTKRDWNDIQRNALVSGERTTAESRSCKSANL